MRDVINAGLDPHRWFAGVMNKIITADLSNKDDPEWVARTKAFLKENVPDNLRQYAKAAKLALHGVTHVEKESELLGVSTAVEESAAKLVDGQTARHWKVQRLSRKGVGRKPEALLLRNE